MKASIIILLFLLFCANAQAQRDTLAMKRSSFPSAFLLSKDHYAKNMGYMCKKELQLQKVVKLPIYVRLGSLDYSNYLEGKRKLQ